MARTKDTTGRYGEILPSSENQRFFQLIKMKRRSAKYISTVVLISGVMIRGTSLVPLKILLQL